MRVRIRGRVWWKTIGMKRRKEKRLVYFYRNRRIPSKLIRRTNKYICKATTKENEWTCVMYEFNMFCGFSFSMFGYFCLQISYYVRIFSSRFCIHRSTNKMFNMSWASISNRPIATFIRRVTEKSTNLNKIATQKEWKKMILRLQFAC